LSTAGHAAVTAPTTGEVGRVVEVAAGRRARVHRQHARAACRIDPDRRGFSLA
jgi:hypothetical protein